jgi:mevalonate kinase
LAQVALVLIGEGRCSFDQKIIDTKELFKTNEHLALEIDGEMERSVMLAEAALKISEKEGFPILVEAIKNANHCFQRWGLDSPDHQKMLMGAGAIATKPTGSGGGGYVLSLWNQAPPAEISDILIPC